MTRARADAPSQILGVSSELHVEVGKGGLHHELGIRTVVPEVPGGHVRAITVIIHGVGEDPGQYEIFLMPP
jgi:hypothetical protein